MAKSRTRRLSSADSIRDRKAVRAKGKSKDSKPEKSTFWQKFAIWSGGVATAVLIATLTPVGNQVGSFISTTIFRQGGNLLMPVRIEAISSIQPDAYAAFVLPPRTRISQKSLARLDRISAISDTDYESWFRAYHGTPAFGGLINFTVVSNTSRPVTITQLEIVKHCGPPLRGAFFWTFLGAGPTTDYRIAFNLDQVVSIGQFDPPTDAVHPLQPGGNYFDRKAVTVSPGEPPQKFVIDVSTNLQSCSFYFRMQIDTSEGTAVNEKITDDGRPFAVTAVLPYKNYSAVYSDNNDSLRFVRVHYVP